jgi:hypothetical protein
MRRSGKLARRFLADEPDPGRPSGRGLGRDAGRDRRGAGRGRPLDEA